MALPRLGFSYREKHHLPSTRKEIEVQDFLEIYGNKLGNIGWVKDWGHRKALSSLRGEGHVVGHVVGCLIAIRLLY
jgi:hypothetical protein